MKVVVLTSSRADFGIYLPLLKALDADTFFELSLIVFGTHLSNYHGRTIDEIKKEKFNILETVDSMMLGDSPEAISNAMGNTMARFAGVWSRVANEIDLVFALGDRYEMFAAVSAALPFGIKIAHLHGGETTLGAIDNALRHAISHVSQLHFTSTEHYGQRVAQLIGDEGNIYNVGSLSLENLENISLLDPEAFFNKFEIDINLETILVTVHPETVSLSKNEQYVLEISSALLALSNNYQILITMPNADTMGTLFREAFLNLSAENASIITVENLGVQGYFSVMNSCKFLLGNTSSGIIEAATFKKYVVNIGDRQKGRSQSDNIYNVSFSKVEILNAVSEIGDSKYSGRNIYYQKNVSKNIIKVLKDNSLD